MSWAGVITNSGKAAYDAYLASGTALKINVVKTGSGIVEESDMRSATALVSEVGVGSIISSSAVEAGVQVRMSIGPNSTSYTLKEVGLYAQVGTGSSAYNVLFALYQEMNGGIVVPSDDEFPDFNLILTSLLDLDNTDDLEITIDQTAHVPMSVFEAGMAEKIDIDQGVGNAGKFLVVGNDGNVVPTTVPFANGVSF